MKRLFLVSLLGSLLTSCASWDKWNDYEEQQAQTDEHLESATTLVAAIQEKENEMAPQPMQQTAAPAPSAAVRFQQTYREQLLTNLQQKPTQAKSRPVKDINFYVRGLMQDLVGNMQYVNASTPLAVTSFVFLDSNYEQAELVGQQISESFIHEVHKFGIPVLDFKTTNYVRVAPSGDFIFSKDYMELTGELPIKYVVAGTLVKHLSGYMVNARIVGLRSKAVVASAQGFLPSSVVNSLISTHSNDGIPLTSMINKTPSMDVNNMSYNHY